MSDIVERLRERHRDFSPWPSMFEEAADEIERLRGENQPVAWRCIADDGVSDVTDRQDIADQWRADGLQVVPLYVDHQREEPS